MAIHRLPFLPSAIPCLIELKVDIRSVAIIEQATPDSERARRTWRRSGGPRLETFVQPLPN
jgi:hypothetical protein